MRTEHPLGPTLVQILQNTPTGSLILAGGLAITLRRQYLIESEAPTLISPLPNLRATTDIDLFIDMVAMEDGETINAVKGGLESIGFAAEQDGDRKWMKFLKHDADLGRMVKVDLHCRKPVPPEESTVSNRIRVKPPSNVEIRGYHTPEAFAIDESPTIVTLTASNSETADAPLAHPFALLCMKLAAAEDWLKLHRQLQEADDEDEVDRRRNQEDYSRRHVYDACVVISMLTPAEYDDAKAQAAKYRSLEHTKDLMAQLKNAATELYESSDKEGWRFAVQQGIADNTHEIIWGVLAELYLAT